MIDLTNTQAVAQNALDAYHRGELQAQTTPSITGRCLYAGPCAIGVSIPVDKRAELDKDRDGSSIRCLIDSKKVSGDVDVLASMQMNHDFWAMGESDEVRAYEETAFLNETTFYAMGLDK